jgi:hypothetical protein
MCNVNSQSHVSEVETIAKRNEGQGYYVMPNKFLEVFAWLFHSQHENYGLLRPISCLEQIVDFEYALMRLVWIILIHPTCVEIPDRGTTHHIYASWTHDTEVDGCVHLFHEP